MLVIGYSGHVGVDDGGPFSATGVARHRYPPGGYGVDATSHTMPHRGVSCHFCDHVVPSFFKNLPQKGVMVQGYYNLSNEPEQTSRRPYAIWHWPAQSELC